MWYEHALRAIPQVDDFTRLRERIAAGERLADRDFDRVFPAEIRALSAVHWTPVAVARRAAEWLAARPGARVLDVGSGVGKFCLIGALATAGEFTGIERRSGLVAVSRELARQYRIPRVRFLALDALAVDWAEFDGVYLFNPFCEARHVARQIDLDIPAGNAAYRQAIRTTRQRLARLRPGARVALYHGFGGRMESGFRRLAGETFGSGDLEIWERD